MADTFFIPTKCSLQAHFCSILHDRQQTYPKDIHIWGKKYSAASGYINSALLLWHRLLLKNVNRRVVLYSGCIHAPKINLMQRYLHRAAGGLFIASVFHSNPQADTVRVETIHRNNQQCDGRLSPVHYRSLFLSASAGRAKSLEKAARRSGGGNSPGWQRLRGGQTKLCDVIACASQPLV